MTFLYSSWSKILGFWSNTGVTPRQVGVYIDVVQQINEVELLKLLLILNRTKTMAKPGFNSETVVKVGLIIDLAYAVAVGVKRIISLFKRKPKQDNSQEETAVQE